MSTFICACWQQVGVASKGMPKGRQRLEQRRRKESLGSSVWVFEFRSLFTASGHQHVAVAQQQSRCAQHHLTPTLQKDTPRKRRQRGRRLEAAPPVHSPALPLHHSPQTIRPHPPPQPLGARVALSAPCHSNSNSYVERQNKALLENLRNFVNA